MKKDIKVKEEWLNSFVISILALFFLSNFLLLMKIFRDLPTLLAQKASIHDTAKLFTKHLVGKIVDELYGIIGVLMLYYFAYKKSGTKFLLLNLILMPISMLVSLFSATCFAYLSAIIQTTKAIQATRYAMVAIISFFIFLITAYFWFNCLRLYKVNKAKKAENKKALE